MRATIFTNPFKLHVNLFNFTDIACRQRAGNLFIFLRENIIHFAALRAYEMTMRTQISVKTRLGRQSHPHQ